MRSVMMSGAKGDLAEERLILVLSRARPEPFHQIDARLRSKGRGPRDTAGGHERVLGAILLFWTVVTFNDCNLLFYTLYALGAACRLQQGRSLYPLNQLSPFVSGLVPSHQRSRAAPR